MGVFVYQAFDERQQRVDGTVSADSPRSARDQLRSQGLSIEALHEQERVRRSTPVKVLLGRRHVGRVAALVRELSTLLSVGVPVVEALDTLASGQQGAFQTATLLVRDQVASGAGLAEALARQPDIFDELTVRMVEVGENAGNLDAVLEQLAEFKERSLGLKDRVTSALLYPAVTFGMALIVSLFLMTAVVPMLLANLVEAGRQLPWPTRVLKALSDFLVGHALLLTVSSVIISVLLVWGLRSNRGQMLWHRTLIRLPLFGPMAQKQAISRIAMVLATLLRSGIVYVRAAEIAATSTRNSVYRNALVESCQQIQAGQDLGEALQSTGVFPPLVIQVFTVGQASGKLEEMLDRMAHGYDRQVASLADRLASALEPVLILLLVVIVGFILFATLLPILEAGNVL